MDRRDGHFVMRMLHMRETARQFPGLMIVDIAERREASPEWMLRPRMDERFSQDVAQGF